MFPSMKGRINRRTYVVGNVVGLAILLAFTLLIVVPLAIIDLVVNTRSVDEIIGVLYFLPVFPATLYYGYFCILTVKRAHDLGWPGLLFIVGFTLALVLGQVLGWYILNMICVIIVLFFALKPGKKARNAFGIAPPRKFDLHQIKITF